MRVETTTNNRKAMAYALAERLGAECRYIGTPTYAYRVGNLTIERDGAIILRSRVGLEAPAEVVPPHSDIYELYRSREKTDVIIVDECQFLTPAQIDQLRDIVDVENIPVLCFGLRTDFQCKLFDGSRRLFEVADTITEIKAICDCGAKATVNARLDSEGCIVTEGAQLLLGGNDRYLAMCHKCWIRNIREHRKVKNR